jgi:DnaA family protein
MRQLILDIRPDAPPDFDNFLLGANAEAVSGLKNATGPAAAYSGDHVIYLWGEKGVGKTHLLLAWSSLTGSDYFPRGALPEPDMALLAVDDVQDLDETDQVRLFSLLNAAREQGGRIVAAGTLPPSQLAVRPDLATRLGQGLIFRIHPLTDADKARALAVRADSHGMHLGEEIIRYMLIHCRRDLPHLLALVDSLDTLSLSRKRPVSLQLLKELVQASPQTDAGDP